MTDPKFERTFNRAMALEREDKPEEAMDLLQALREEYGDSNPLLIVMALLALHKLVDFWKAIELAKRAVEVSPLNESASITLVKALLETAQMDAVNEEIRRYVRLGGEIDQYKLIFEANNLTVDDYK